ncbi:hypothetical protein [Micromonospora endolithica]|uniref:Uncharacterized protein n=1 Tax=Micromonospora endolithica TaxID=230091 RepID=A0A3A9YU80_9ACTN|nr:hypothetical protein [Micromonospora endolithica]RKN39588.1 hypothetical protein D7223_28190 [Micromonospora endolithica]TWJ22282.1 hypothetical protein JD76_02397 [Micromonospora endolithica]
MSDTSRNRPDRHTDRPEGVTDPLLWGLALDVADAHQPDDDDTCHNLLCAGRAWPCEPWHRAQRALQMAQATSGGRSTDAPPEQARPGGWSAVAPTEAHRLRSAVPQGGRRGSAASAA